MYITLDVQLISYTFDSFNNLDFLHEEESESREVNVIMIITPDIVISLY